MGSSDITGEKMAKIISAAKVNVEAFWPGLFAKALQGRNIGDLICNVGSAPAAGGGAPAAAAGGDAAAAAPAEEKKEEKKEESESDLMMTWDLDYLTNFCNYS